MDVTSVQAADDDDWETDADFVVSSNIKEIFLTCITITLQN